MTRPANWNDYRWQLRNAAHTTKEIAAHFPGLPVGQLNALREYQQRYRFNLTPYLLDQLQLDEKGIPAYPCPFNELFLPNPDVQLKTGDASYDPSLMNWEMPEELVIPGSAAFHWKYTDRLLYRATGCMSICSYCFEAHRVVDKETQKHPKKTDWELGMDFLRNHPHIREFVFSGGDPLLAPDDLLEERLKDLRSIPSIETIRFNSAVLMHCPMRVTPKLVELFKQYEVTSIGIHIVHPRQLKSEESHNALQLLDRCGVIKLAQVPLLAGVNDSPAVMRQLLHELEYRHVKAYYLLHGMPWTLGATQFRTSVYQGVELMRPMHRHLSNVAFPEYIIVARGGKKNVPFERNDFWLHKSQVQKTVWAVDDMQPMLADFALEGRGDLLKFNGTPEFIYSSYQKKPVIVFLNWKNQWEMYLDGAQAQA
ncbi:MAG TPA: radical SAM protein [Candidatus Paceibacterota bacterium]|nr:radical SAM protein [Candidatus Paceibacterota bacterium]